MFRKTVGARVLCASASHQTKENLYRSHDQDGSLESSHVHLERLPSKPLCGGLRNNVHSTSWIQLELLGPGQNWSGDLTEKPRKVVYFFECLTQVTQREMMWGHEREAETRRRQRQTEKLGARLTRSSSDSVKVNIFTDITDHQLHHFNSERLWWHKTAFICLKPQGLFRYCARQGLTGNEVNHDILKGWRSIFFFFFFCCRGEKRSNMKQSKDPPCLHCESCGSKWTEKGILKSSVEQEK